MLRPNLPAGGKFQHMILSKPKLLQAIRSGDIAVTPFNAEHVGACSIDLTLSRHFRRFKTKGTVRLTGGLDYQNHTFAVEATVSKPVKIKPGELVLGATAEKIRLSDKYCGWIQGRSRIARLGLSVHVSSSLIQPGVDNVQVLEIVNNAPFAIILAPGVRVCQVVFEELSGSGARYSGGFSRQERP